MLMTLRQIPDRSLNWIPSDRIRRHNTTLLLSSVAQSDLITVNAFVLVFLVMRGALILVNGYFSNCLSLFMTHSLSCFSPPLSSPLLSVCLTGLRSCCPPAPFLGARDDIITQQPRPWECLFITLIIIGSISSITCVCTHVHTGAHTDRKAIKREERPDRLCRIASLKERGRGPQRGGGTNLLE